MTEERHPVEGKLLERLAALERELRVLRRELSISAPGPGALPTGNFEVLRYRLGETCYGVSIDQVREIIRYVAVTDVADVPDVVLGAIDVRGEIVAVIDGRRRFGKEPTPPRRKTAIVLLSFGGRSVGIVVDEVVDVVPVMPEQLTEPDGLLAGAEAVLAIATLHGDVVQIVDLERVLDASEWRRVSRALESVPPRGDDDGATDVDDLW